MLEPLNIINNKCPCGCNKIFEERKSITRNGDKYSGFYIPSWMYSSQRWGHPVPGRWHFIRRVRTKPDGEEER